MPKLFDSPRAMRDFKFTDTWDPAGTDHRDDDWLGATWEDYDETYGYRVYRCVKNTSASSIATALVVETEAGETNQDHVDPSGANAGKPRVRGVTIGAIPAGYMGWVVCKGRVVATDSGSGLTVDTPIQAAASGDVADATIGTHAVIGTALAAVSAGATGTVYIDVL